MPDPESGPSYPPLREVNADILRPLTQTGPRYVVLVCALAAVSGWGLFAWGWQIRHGMGVAGIDQPVCWALYITNFVFWVGISHSGTMISAILRLTKAEWRYPITRPAELMTVFSLCMAALFPLIHLGRTWLFWYMIPIPNQRGLWPDFRSPLLWDMTAIFTYLTGSSLFLFVALVPDLGAFRERVGGWRRPLYRLFSLGWRGTHRQWRWLERAAVILTVVIIPVFVSVHTIVSWDFGMALVPGWHSAIFAPYFVVGAILSGVAAAVTLMTLLRWAFHLERYLTPYHFDRLGQLLLAVSLLWGFFFAADMLVPYLAGEPAEQPGLIARTVGAHRDACALMITVNLLIPVAYLAFRRARRWIPGFFVVTILINVGMFLERYLIIVPSLGHKSTPFSWGGYTPTWVELSITAASFAGFSLLYVLTAKVVPLLPVWELKEGRHALSRRRVGDTNVPESLAPLPEPDLPAPPPVEAHAV